MINGKPSRKGAVMLVPGPGGPVKKSKASRRPPKVAGKRKAKRKAAKRKATKRKVKRKVKK